MTAQDHPPEGETAPGSGGGARRTSRRVHLADRAAGVVITVGGMAVIFAILAIFVYLGAVAGRLVASGELRPGPAGRAPGAGDALLMMIDEAGVALATLEPDGALRVALLATGEPVVETPVAPQGRTITAVSRAARGDHVAIGYDDGSFQIGTIGFATECVPDDAAPAARSDVPGGGARKFGESVAQRTAIGQVRTIRPAVRLAAPVALGAGTGAVTHIDYVVAASREAIVARRADGVAAIYTIRKQTPLGGGPARVTVEPHALPMGGSPASAPALDWLLAMDDGEFVLAASRDGSFARYDTVDPARPTLAETGSLVEPGRSVTAQSELIGGRTLAVGDDAGGVSGFFAARSPLATTPDKRRLVRAHTLPPQGSAIVSIAPSSRDRTFLTAGEDGSLVVRHMTSGKTVARGAASRLGGPPALSALAPKADAFVALAPDGSYEAWSLTPGHPEATARSLFGRVWYEGDEGPTFTYQSSSGDDAAEPKLSLTPLIVGTLKATVYTMIIAAPLAILAAMFTSEFLRGRTRAVVKPAIEMMASLPSVVLGFIAAIVLAPALRDHLPGVLIAFGVTPLAALAGAHLWHFAPVRLSARTGDLARLGMAGAATLGAIGLCVAVGPAVERALFTPSGADLLVLAGSYEPVEAAQRPAWMGARESLDDRLTRRLRREGLYFRDGLVVRAAGSLHDPEVAARVARHGYDAPNIRQWLNGVFGGPWPGWLLLCVPLGAFVVWLANSRVVEPRLASFESAHASPALGAAVEMARLVLGAGATLGLAALLASALSAIGLDPRDSIFGPHQQANSLVVGIAMSIAVIPIIYTISDDAMTSVPASLRSASLGSGATRWQTAARVVLPAAGSGVFSALMIGLGRAVGETMIVLMATGNTPIMDWNIFEGMRTLSANIAVELPEAPRDTTHYRVLFLCGLVLLVVTFIVNTVAEVVRQRFRRRTAGL